MVWTFRISSRETCLRSSLESMTRDPRQNRGRNRKRLRPNELAEWEVRIGDFRVFYDVDQENKLIKIEAVGYKKGSQLFIRGKEYKL